MQFMNKPFGVVCALTSLASYTRTVDDLVSSQLTSQPLCWIQKDRRDIVLICDTNYRSHSDPLIKECICNIKQWIQLKIQLHSLIVARHESKLCS
jgi:hypothetical protein